ncbi:exonuclease domain-containing protein [Rhizosphaericola mali]|uniref:DNA polymerase III subunit epsilon n=1 Tax=Rhizosphaericola mali TaxID=2545455 RepID=A0A5P2G0X0_9BACT|nr:exonuclease domain-containing protein [Rhizosphaericola mali]QES89454.1 DNA polymerase III subunit epsilon [Rhizosphaericola mali]
MQEKEYAIVDIETTGGHCAVSGITDIAIVIHDGQKVIDRYETLINPVQHIPYFIESLTGISNEMVKNAPLFEDVASEIYSWLNGRVFVAHNVNFDFSFVSHYLSLAGYSLKAPKLCTVRMSRRVVPGLTSYSLGNLCASLNIPIYNRHRAGGDADATAELFTYLNALDTEDCVEDMLKRGKKEHILPPNLSKGEFEKLPTATGVYFFLDNKFKVIYVGKAKNIQKRVGQHFTGNNTGSQRQNFLREIHHIRFEICGTELMAFLLEAAEIKHRWPKYNRSLKQFEPKYGLFEYYDINGFKRLAIGRVTRNQQCLQYFSSEEDGRDLLHALVKDFSLCSKKCMLGSCQFVANCYSCTIWEDTKDAYNERVEDAIAHLHNYLSSYIIVDKGRDEGEKSIIWIENGIFWGMGYVDINQDITDMEIVQSSLTRYNSCHYMVQLVNTFAFENPQKTIMK